MEAIIKIKTGTTGINDLNRKIARLDDIEELLNDRELDFQVVSANASLEDKDLKKLKTIDIGKFTSAF